MAIDESPAEASNDTGQSGARSTTMVSGPGQKAFAKVLAMSGNTPRRKAASALATWAMRGLKAGLPFVA